MTVFETFRQALGATPYPVTQQPITLAAPVCLTYFLVASVLTAHASGKARRIRHTVQVDIYARAAVGPEIDVVVGALRAAGIGVTEWGPADYERDTRWHHMPITCTYNEKTEE